jgi:hypothetical protein
MERKNKKKSSKNAQNQKKRKKTETYIDSYSLKQK